MLLIKQVEEVVQKVKETLISSNLDEKSIEKILQEVREKEEERYFLNAEEARSMISELLNKSISESTFRRIIKNPTLKIRKKSNKEGLQIFIPSIYDYVKEEQTSKADLISEINDLKLQIESLKKENEALKKNKKEVIQSKNEQIKEETNAPDGQMDFYASPDVFEEGEVRPPDIESPLTNLLDGMNKMIDMYKENGQSLSRFIDKKDPNNVSIEEVKELTEQLFEKNWLTGEMIDQTLKAIYPLSDGKKPRRLDSKKKRFADRIAAGGYDLFKAKELILELLKNGKDKLENE